MELTNLETKILEMQTKEVRKFLRLSSERDLYTYNQAAYRLNTSRNTFEAEFVKSGLLKITKIREKCWISKIDIDALIESNNHYVHKDSLNR